MYIMSVIFYLIGVDIMANKGLSKVIDADKESEYGYVFGVSGPGELCSFLPRCIIFI